MVEGQVLICQVPHSIYDGTWDKSDPKDAANLCDLLERAKVPFYALPEEPLASLRLVGTLRRECLDFLIPLTEDHLRGILKEWCAIAPEALRKPTRGLGFPICLSVCRHLSSSGISWCGPQGVVVSDGLGSLPISALFESEKAHQSCPLVSL